MASRRDRDTRRGYDEDDRGARRGERTERRSTREEIEPEDRIRGDPPRETKKARAGEATDPTDLNKFFIDGKGINREVLQKELCRFLGPEATSKPDMYKGVEGYLIKSFRPFTTEMHEDLIRISERYVSERDDTRRRGRDLQYDKSEVNRRRDAMNRPDLDRDRDDDDRYDEYKSYDKYPSYDKKSDKYKEYEDERGPSRTARTPRERPEIYENRNPRGEPEVPYPYRRERDPYGSMSAAPAYGTEPAYRDPPMGAVYPRAGGAYDPNTPPPQVYSANPPAPGYPNPGYPVNIRSGNPGPGNPNSYVYGGEPVGNLSNPYGGTGPYPVSSTAPPLRSDPRGYPSRDIQEPRYPGYPPQMGREDVSMGGIDDYEDYPPRPPGPPGRPGYSSTSREQPSHERHSPDIREPYRARPAREEQRRPRPRP